MAISGRLLEREISMNCHACGAEVDAKGVYCHKCGARLDEFGEGGPQPDEPQLTEASSDSPPTEETPQQPETARERFQQATASRQGTAEEPEKDLWEGSR